MCPISLNKGALSLVIFIMASPSTKQGGELPPAEELAARREQHEKVYPHKDTLIVRNFKSWDNRLRS
jgi:hypothetical protein